MPQAPVRSDEPQEPVVFRPARSERRRLSGRPCDICSLAVHFSDLILFDSSAIHGQCLALMLNNDAADRA